MAEPTGAHQPELPPETVEGPPRYAIVAPRSPISIHPNGYGTELGYEPLVVAYLGREGDWAVINPGRPAREDFHCQPTNPAFAPFDVRLYVPLERLVPTVASKTRWRFPNGTAIVVAPGVAIDSGVWGPDATLQGGDLYAAFPKDELRTELTYVADPLELPDTREAEFPDGDFMMGQLEQKRPIPADFAVSELTRDPDGSTLIIGGNRCIQVRARWAESDDSPVKRPEDSALTAVPRGWVLPAGATVYWPDGSVAGSMQTTVRSMLRPRAGEVSDLECFDMALRLRACFAAGVAQYSEDGVVPLVEWDVELYRDAGDGRLAQDAKIEAIVAAARPKLEECVVPWVGKPGLSFSMAAKFDVDQADGHIHVVQHNHDERSWSIQSCLINTVVDLEFPPLDRTIGLWLDAHITLSVPPP